MRNAILRVIGVSPFRSETSKEVDERIIGVQDGDIRTQMALEVVVSGEAEGREES
jgi:hypothetical protein